MSKRKHRADGGELSDSITTPSPLNSPASKALQKYNTAPGFGGFIRGMNAVRAKSHEDEENATANRAMSKKWNSQVSGRAGRRGEIDASEPMHAGEFDYKRGGKVKKRRKTGGKVIGLMTGGAVRSRLDRRARGA